jgi:hypothetical protein
MGKNTAEYLLYAGLAAGAAYVLYKSMKPIADTLAGQGKVFNDVSGSLGGNVKEVGNSATGTFTTGSDAVNQAISDLSNIQHTGLTAGNDIFGDILAATKKMSQMGEDVVSSATEAVKNGISSFLGGVSEVLNPNVTVQIAKPVPAGNQDTKGILIATKQPIIPITASNIGSVVSLGLTPTFANSTTPANDITTITNGLNNAQLANALIAKSSSSNSHTTNQASSAGAALKITVTKPNGQVVSLVRSSVVGTRSGQSVSPGSRTTFK